MEELYKAIEEKIKSCGYPRAISGEAVYEAVSYTHLTLPTT